MRKLIRFFKKVIALSFAFSVLLVVVYRFLPVPITPLMVIRNIEQKELGWSHDWVSIQNMSPNLPLAVVASEDQNFLHHYGFDFQAIEKALKHNKKGKRIRGGSTISQQTAKNVFLWQDRTWVRKGLEVYFTGLIEVFWPKKRIMEVYLNSIEMGNGVYGAEAASKHWYQKSSSNLSRREAAGIAAILPNPRKFKASNSSGYIEGRKSQITRQMGYIGKLDY